MNTITFIDRNRRFVSTSDDKSIRVWEWDIPVDIKYIAEPSMHAIPSVSLSYTGKWMACQSMDNEITIFGTAKLRQNRKKIFKGKPQVNTLDSLHGTARGKLYSVSCARDTGLKVTW